MAPGKSAMPQVSFPCDSLTLAVPRTVDSHFRKNSDSEAQTFYNSAGYLLVDITAQA